MPLAPDAHPRPGPVTRRRLVLASAAGLAGLGTQTWLAAADGARVLAPMTEGPFYPPARWRGRNPVNDSDWDQDLTRVQRGSQVQVARGEHLGLDLRVVDSQGRPIDRAEVEVWQCDALAQYRHPGVAAEPGRFDPGFQGFGAARSAADGSVAFRTIRPVAYPGRTPHIHVKLRHPTFGELTSQLFVAGDPGNARDFLWRSLGAVDRDALALVLRPNGDEVLKWTARHPLVVPA